MDSAGTCTPFSPHLVVGGRYELLRLIGQGGMGEVWEARHLDLDAPVAIKFAVERRVRDRSFLTRFRQEARALARLRFPCIVQVFDFGVHGEFPFMVMELLIGETLKSRLERESRLKLHETAVVIDQVARALSAIHRADMVHRDVTPANVFLMAHSAELGGNTVKLLDFGIVKDTVAETRVTVSGVVVGSPAYMSPEQARAERVDKRSDLWSLGALTYRAVTGRDPFLGSCVTDVLFAICTGEIASVSPPATNCVSALDAFFTRALARNPEHRFQSALEMSEAFSNIALESEESAASDSAVSSITSRLHMSLGRSSSTLQMTSCSLGSQRSGSPPHRLRVLGILAMLLTVLSSGIAIGYNYVGQHRESAIAQAPLQPAALVATTPAPVAAPSVLLQSAASAVDAGSERIVARRETATAPLTAARRRTTKPAAVPGHVKDEVDPVFGLPVHQ